MQDVWLVLEKKTAAWHVRLNLIFQNRGQMQIP